MALVPPVEVPARDVVLASGCLTGKAVEAEVAKPTRKEGEVCYLGLSPQSFEINADGGLGGPLGAWACLAFLRLGGNGDPFRLRQIKRDGHLGPRDATVQVPSARLKPAQPR